jgi:hypothetical protein
MANNWEEVRLGRQENGGFLLERWDATRKLGSIVLGETNLLSLLPLIQRECAQLLANRLTPDLKEQGVEPIVTIPVTGFAIGEDLHQQEIFLTFQDEDGNQYRFSFESAGNAQRVAQRLLARAEKVGMAKPPTKQ